MNETGLDLSQCTYVGECYMYELLLDRCPYVLETAKSGIAAGIDKLRHAVDACYSYHTDTGGPFPTSKKPAASEMPTRMIEGIGLVYG